MRFAPAPEYQVFPTRERPLKPYEAACARRGETRAAGARRSRPTSVVADILTLGAGAGRRARGRAGGDARPPRRPAHGAPGFPPYSIGARLPRTRARARGCGGALDRARRDAGSSAGARELNETRARGSACAPLPRVHGGHLARAGAGRRRSRSSSTRARGRPWTHVVGPLLWEPPGERRRAAAGRRAARARRALDRRRTREHRLLRAALRGPGGRAGARDRDLEPPRAARPADRRARQRARSSPWLSYAQTMPRCDVVVCHGGHGTLVRALASGCAGRRLPGRRATWTRTPRASTGPASACGSRAGCARRARCAWRCSARWPSPRLRARARELAAWSREHDRRRARPSSSRSSPREAGRRRVGRALRCADGSRRHMRQSGAPATGAAALVVCLLVWAAPAAGRRCPPARRTRRSV